MSQVLSIVAGSLAACCVMPGVSVASDTFDWAYQFGADAVTIYAQMTPQARCADIPELLRQKRSAAIYIAIRDAGLFVDPTCEAHIKENERQLMSLDGVRDAIAFYRLQREDRTQLKILLSTFDRAGRSGDHWIVDLFGYLPDWEVTGRRLVKTLKKTDGAGSELLCSALMWKRYLYGEKDFRKNWFAIGAQEAIDEKRLRYYFDTCRPKLR